MQTPAEHPFDLNSPFLQQPMNSCQVYLVNLKEKEIVSHQPFNIHTKKPTVHETRKIDCQKIKYNGLFNRWSLLYIFFLSSHNTILNQFTRNESLGRSINLFNHHNSHPQIPICLPDKTYSFRKGGDTPNKCNWLLVSYNQVFQGNISNCCIYQSQRN